MRIVVAPDSFSLSLYGHGTEGGGSRSSNEI